MMFNLILFLGQAFAEDHGGAEHAAHGDPHAIPWGNIFVQAFNLGLLVALLVYLLHKTVKAHFENRARDYQQLVSRAEAARQEAERGKQNIKERLAKLESSADQGLAQARAEAEELRGRMIQEAKTLAARLESEAERTAKVEAEKAKAELRRDLLQQALSETREDLKKLGSTDQKKLQAEFADKIQVVGQ